MTLPPLMSRFGAKFSQELRCASVFHALRSGPTSASTVCIVITSMPSISVALTPRMRSNSSARAKSGWLPFGLRGRRFLPVSVAATDSLAVGVVGSASRVGSATLYCFSGLSHGAICLR